MSAHPFPIDLRPWFHRFARWTARDALPAFAAGELESVADLAALKAWQRYDAAAGFAFTTYARWSVLGAVRRAVARRRRASTWVPLDAVDEQLARQAPLEAVVAARRALAALDELDQLLLLRHVLADESLDALARDLALPKTTVWRRIQDAKKRARMAISHCNERAPIRRRSAGGA